MELTLVRQANTQINVTCDGQPSHTFDLKTLAPNKEKGLPQPLDNPVAYGKAIYQALFPAGSPAQLTLNKEQDRILLVTTDENLDAVPWEYVYGPNSFASEGFLVTVYHFVRGLPADQRIPPPKLDTNLHIVAVPSKPLHADMQELNIDAEWMRIKEIVQNVHSNITLERTHPPTLEQLRRLLVNQHHRVIHFMGHGGQLQTGAVLCFEKENGTLDPVTAQSFVLRVRKTIFLVVLNACVSATPGPTALSNLAAALVRQKTPYALGMRFTITDDDARIFSRTFYNDLAGGSAVEEALLQARSTLLDTGSGPWAVGVPVLYTALAEPAVGFSRSTGTPAIDTHQPRVEASALPHVEGVFQGRLAELVTLGEHLTGDARPLILTIHGGGGQGKTALASEAVERFAHAWSGGVWAISLENLPTREVFVNQLARFLGINTQEVTDPAEIERHVQVRLIQQRTLIVLDNMETLIEAVEKNDAAALHLVKYIRQLPGPSVSLLVTSRVHLQWNGEVSLELGGLTPQEGALLFRQSAPQRAEEVAIAMAQQLSQKLEGHPLSLRLLGSAFNDISIPLHAFVAEYEEQLGKAENKYENEDHRHRRLYACIDTSVRYLDGNLRSLLSGLPVFRAPFLAETAVSIFNPQAEDTDDAPSPIHDQLYTLWQRSLLSREIVTVRDGTLLFYRLLPTTRPYVEHYLEQDYEQETLLARFGAEYAQLAKFLYDNLDKSAAAVTIAQQAGEDLEEGSSCVTGMQQGYYLLYWGWILQRLGITRRGLQLLERALEIVQGQDQSLELQALSNMATVYWGIGQSQEALKLYEQSLPRPQGLGRPARSLHPAPSRGILPGTGDIRS